jgi:hypothetical protein
LNPIFNVKSNDNKRNSCLLENGNDDIKNRKKSASQFNSKPHPSPKNYFLILISIFFIVVPIGLEPQLQTNYVFGESDFRSQNVDYEHHDKGEAQDSASSSSSESRTKQDLIDPFDSGDNSNIKKLNENFVIPDIFGTQDHHSSTSTDPGSTKSSDSQSELQSESELEIQSQYKSSSGYVDDNNADGRNTNEHYDKSANVLGTDVQSDPSSSSINNNTKTKANEEVTVSGDLSNTNSNNQIGSSTSSESESQSSNQPRYKSYRDYIDNNMKNDTTIQTHDKPVSEVNSMDSQVSASGDNVSQATNEKINALEYSMSIPSSNLNGNADELANKLANPENQSTSESNPTTSFQSQADKQSSDLNSTVTSQPLYKSYKDFVEHNKANEIINNDINASSKSVEELDSSNAASSQVTG